MKKLLSCREVWCYDDCDYIVAGETEEDVMRSAAEHVIKEHGKTKKYSKDERKTQRIHLYSILLRCHIDSQ
jgi:predicted small metal-binding protein